MSYNYGEVSKLNRFDETIKLMQNITSEIKQRADEKVVGLDYESKTMVQTVAAKTIDVINEAAVKLNAAINKIDDEAELNNFLDRVESKCIEAKKYAFAKFDEVSPAELAEYVTIKDDEESETSTMEKLLDNDNIKNAANFIINIKDNVVNYINKPETKQMISKAKLAALGAADKGLDKLIQVLDKKKDED